MSTWRFEHFASKRSLLINAFQPIQNHLARLFMQLKWYFIIWLPKAFLYCWAWKVSSCARNLLWFLAGQKIIFLIKIACGRVVVFTNSILTVPFFPRFSHRNKAWQIEEYTHTRAGAFFGTRVFFFKSNFYWTLFSKFDAAYLLHAHTSIIVFLVVKKVEINLVKNCLFYENIARAHVQLFTICFVKLDHKSFLRN